MFLKFLQFANGKMTLVPMHKIKFIQDHDDGGAIIYTDIPASDPTKTRNFRTKETANELYEKSKINASPASGLFSSL